MTPVFFMFADRQKAYDVIEAVTGFRMHPAWFRIGGVAHDLPRGWDVKVREFLDWFPQRLDEYVTAAVENSMLRGRCIGVAPYDTAQALEWGVTGAGLRATGCAFDYRKARPYSGYEQLRIRGPGRHERRLPTIAAWSGSRNCARAAASSASASSTCPRDPTRPITRSPARRRASACSRTSKP